MFVAGLDRREGDSMVLFGTIQSLYNKFHELVPPPPPDLIVIDEARASPHTSTHQRTYCRPQLATPKPVPVEYQAYVGVTVRRRISCHKTRIQCTKSS